MLAPFQRHEINAVSDSICILDLTLTCRHMFDKASAKHRDIFRLVIKNYAGAKIDPTIYYMIGRCATD